ncbi:adenylate/guanylate cyclase domain-containing protein [Arenimonas caeni]|jgi:adenylate cyclase|uniref:Adenylate/guanylate cyclase domain-containing protein n=1 Tax=Arenimonas caeni TaxID=2058085 RepID=A0A2P6M850_9GAMM|nr:adenylate/guanylate cyclase domain-containing protein [Arenimonas caeni]MDY0020923.1 adenylate/guanylate cyclase domain-containing protein [Arenimonas caeni]PRH82182.1 adenylate/guanylate cyclase domain-containing protein [Arenimonas caeni]
MPPSKHVPIRLPLLALTVLAIVLQLGGVLERADNRLGDWLLAGHAAGRQPPDDIVVVAIDQKSLDELNEVAGSWPWPRSVHGELLDGLAAHGPKAVAFDFMFNEYDSFRLDSDEVFREIVAGQDNLFFASMRLADGNRTPLSLLPPSFGAERRPGADPGASATLLVPGVLDPESWRGGLINFEADGDGVGRHARLYEDIDGWRLHSMAANLARFSGTTLPDRARIRINWYGRLPPTIAYSDLFNDLGQREPAIAPSLAGKLVVVAPTAPGLHDLRPTPLGQHTQGVHVITTALANLRSGDWLHDLPARWPLAALLVAGVALAFHRRRSPLQAGLGLGLASLLVLGGAWAALGAHLYLPVAAALLLAWLGYGLLTVEAQWIERRQREATVGIFGRFLDPRVVEGLVESGELDRGRKPEARDISILFSDIRGFTTLSETRTPEQVVDLLNRYFSRQVDVIFRHGGTLDKFIGDAIMAFWNAPTETPGHAEKAVEAALDMTLALDDFKRELAANGEGLGDFDVGIGLHTGPAVVGFLGSDSRMEYTAIGDTVNLASRIEGTTKGVARVLVSEDTKARCGAVSRFEFLYRGQFKVKGREKPVELYEPVRRPLQQQAGGNP